MAFDLKSELARVAGLTEALRSLIAAGGTGRLDNVLEFTARCERLGQQARELVATLPPGAKTSQRVRIRVEGLGKASVLGRLLGFRRQLVDVEGHVFVTYSTRLEIPLDEPRMPGDPTVVVEQEIRVPKVMQLPLTSPGEPPPRPLPPGSIGTSRAFRYVVLQARRRAKLRVDAVPAGPPPSPVTAAYLRRQRELAGEVREVFGLIAEFGDKIGTIHRETQTLRDQVEAVARRIELFATLANEQRALEAQAERLQVLNAEIATAQSGLRKAEEDWKTLDREIETLLT